MNCDEVDEKAGIFANCTIDFSGNSLIEFTAPRSRQQIPLHIYGFQQVTNIFHKCGILPSEMLCKINERLFIDVLHFLQVQ